MASYIKKFFYGEETDQEKLYKFTLEFMSDKFSKMMYDIESDMGSYGNSLRQRLGLPIADFDVGESQFYKFCQRPHINKGVQDRENK